MIKEFKELESRDSGVIYKSWFEQVKKVYEKNPEEGGELAVSIMEQVLTGSYSSDNYLVDVILTQNKVIIDKDKDKWDREKAAKEQASIEKMKLKEIAEMLNNGATQKVIADTLGESPTTINYRVKQLRTKYQYLLENTKNTKNTNDVNVNVNDNVNVNVSSLSSKEKISPPSSESWGDTPQSPLNQEREKTIFEF